MRLRALITTRLLSEIISLLKIYSKDELIISFTETDFSFSVPQDQFGGIWVGCSADKVFQQYDVASKYDNMLLLKIDPTKLSNALTSDEKTNSIRLQLTQSNKEVFLQFTHSTLDKSKKLTHNVPVQFLKTQYLSTYAEPNYEATMAACLPPLLNLKSWCANAVNISKYVTISIIRHAETGESEVVFRVENDSHLASISTRFRHMEVPNSSVDDALFDPDTTQCEVTVDLKRFNKILKVETLKPQLSLLYIQDKKSLRVHFDAEYATITHLLVGITT